MNKKFHFFTLCSRALVGYVYLLHFRASMRATARLENFPFRECCTARAAQRQEATVADLPCWWQVLAGSLRCLAADSDLPEATAA